jgi:hypothetical protein
MPLFVCDKCKCIENSAMGQWATRGRYGNSPEALCSECRPYVKFECPGGLHEEGGRWHGKFPKEIATKELIKAYGETNFVYVSNISGVKAKSPCAPKK